MTALLKSNEREKGEQKMLKIENTEVYGWEAAIRGMRNPMNSWDQSDSGLKIMNPGDVEVGYEPIYEYVVGEKDIDLMHRLRKAGTDHRKFMRMITVTFDLTAPLYWFKEFDTYKISTVANSCSTMHKIHAKEFTLDDFSHEKMSCDAVCVLNMVIDMLNTRRKDYNETKRKIFWDDMIQLLPSSYNQRRTILLNYEVLANIYKSRKNHKLTEWHTFCDWIETLPYSELITGKEE
jgi:hypothetical protein